MIKTCEVCGSTTWVVHASTFGGYLCSKHNIQFRRYGKILKRTNKDPNEIVIKKNYAEVILYKNGVVGSRSKVDIEDIPLVSKYHWYQSLQGYAFSRSNGRKLISMHALITSPGVGSVVDHIFHDKLDNRKSQLRVCTYRQNLMNNSKAIGVYLTESGKWIASITLEGKTKNLGTFPTKEEALEVRSKAEEKYFGEFACKYKYEEKEDNT